MGNLSFFHYLPIGTTLISVLFAALVYRRYRLRGGGIHLVWWSAGILVYGLGTFAESWITLFGWNPVIFKFWYIVGALLGGAPLAQGTVWLLMKPRTARALTPGLVSVVVLAAASVLASPINYELVNPNLPSGRAFGWQWVRAFSPFINTYAVIFLIGGAFWSAWRFHKAWRVDGRGAAIAHDRFVGNVLIAVGAILPGLGGGASRMGHTEYLYMGEFVGILLIAAGYWYNVRKRPIHAPRAARAVTASLALAMIMGSASPTIAEPVAPQAGAPNASIEVLVSGPDGAMMPRVPIRVRDAGGAEIRLVTDAQGGALAQTLAPGRYVVVIDVLGFRPLEQVVRVQADRRRVVRVRLMLAPLAEQVTVAATKTERAVERDPGEVAVIERQDLDHLQARSLDDVFRYEPGIEMSEAPRRLGQTPNIRGFDDQRILTLRDGARVAQFNSGHRGTYFFDVEDIEQVEVIKGPASALYGSGAIGGVISITTRDPGDLLKPSRQVGGQIRTGFSSAYNEFMFTPRLYGQTPSGFGWLLSYTARRNDGTVKLAGPPDTLSQAEEDINAFNGRFTAPVSDRDLLRFSFDYYRHQGRSSTNLAIVEVGAPELIDRQTTNVTGNLRYTHTGERWWDRSVNATFYVDRADIDEVRLADDRTDDIRYATWGLDVRNTAPLGSAHSITYGLEFVRERQDATRNEEVHAFFPAGRRTQLGAYVQDEISLASGRLSIVPGLRFDSWNSRPDDLALETRQLDRLSPKLGLTYEIVDGLVGSVSYGAGFRAPYFQELFLQDVHFAFPLPGNRFFLALFLPNPDLSLETTRNVDLGLRYRNHVFSVRGAYWRADVEDFIELLPIHTGPFPPPGGIQIQLWQALNRQDAVLKGFESGLDWAPHRDWLLRGV